MEEGKSICISKNKKHPHSSADSTHREDTSPIKPQAFREIQSLVLTNINYIFIVKIKKKSFTNYSTSPRCSFSLYFANTFMYYRKQKQLTENTPTMLIYLDPYIDYLIIRIWTGAPNNNSSIFNKIVGESLKLIYVFGSNRSEEIELRIFLEPDGTFYLSLFRKRTHGHLFLHYTYKPPAFLKEEPHPPSLKTCAPSKNFFYDTNHHLIRQIHLIKLIPTSRKQNNLLNITENVLIVSSFMHLFYPAINPAHVKVHDEPKAL
jgi:hypothetical protein